MAGCFGNHPVDRWMESQLYSYLDDCDDYDHFCEQVAERYTDDVPDTFFDTDVENKWLEKLYNKFISAEIDLDDVAIRIERAYKIFIKNKYYD